MSRYADIVKKEAEFLVPETVSEDRKDPKIRIPEFIPKLYNPVLLTSNPDYVRWKREYLPYLLEMRHLLIDIVSTAYPDDKESLETERFFREFCKFIRINSSGRLVNDF